MHQVNIFALQDEGVINMSADAKNNKELLYWINVGIVLILMLGFGKLPPIEPITAEGMKVVGIFLGLIYGWITCGPIWPSFAGIVILVMSGSTTISNILNTGLGSETCMFVMFVFIFTYQISQTQLDQFLAVKLLCLPFLQGRPWLFSGTFLIGCAVITGLTSNPFAMIVIFWVMLYDIVKELGYKPYDKWPTVMIIGVVLAASLGQCLMPFSALVVILNGIFTAMSGVSVPATSWILFTIPMIILSMLLYVLICRYIFKPDVSLVKNFSSDMINQSAAEFTKEKKVMLFMLLLFVVALIAPKMLPATSRISASLGSLGNFGITILCLLIMSLIRIDHKPFFNFGECAKNGVIWSVLGMMMAVLPVGNLLTAENTGVKPFLVNLISGLFSGVGSVVFVICVCALTILLTNLLNDAIVGMILMTVLVSCSAAFSISLIPAAILVIFGSHIAILLPSSSPYAAMMHGNDGWLKQKDIYKYAMVTFPILMIFISCVGYFWANIIA